MLSVGILICCYLLRFSSAGKAEMISKCAVNGTQVQFHCSGADAWYIDSMFIPDSINVETITLDANLDADTGPQNFTITCNFGFTGYRSANLIVVDEDHPQAPLTVTVLPINKTTLLLEWEDPSIYEYIEHVYKVGLSLEKDYQEVMELNEPSVELNLDGKECMPFQVNISMPGNCDDVIVVGSLLINPPYPTMENITAIALNNKTVLLMWQQPENIFKESNFTYNITAVSVTTGALLEHQTITYDPSVSPQERFNFSNVSICEEISFTLIQIGDCREKNTTIFLPIFPGPFLSEVQETVLFSEYGDVGHVEVEFQPPDLCEFQMKTATYVLDFSDGSSSWSTSPEEISNRVIFTDKTHFIRDKEYTVTATVMTAQGNVSSALNFSTTSPLGEARLDENTLVCTLLDDSSVHITWDNPTNTLRNSFTYIIYATLVSTGKRVAENTVLAAIGDAPFITFDLHQYTCEEVELSVYIFNSNESISQVVTVPAYPKMFKENVTVNTFMVGGKIKEVEVTFTPPQLCDFQSASYMMIFSSSDSETWSRDVVTITDTAKPVKEDIETGFVLNKNYTVTITVFMDHGNITSTDNFRFLHPTLITVTTGFLDPTLTTVTGMTVGLSSLELAGSTLGGALGVLFVLICGFAAGVVAVYYLRLRKRRKIKAGLSARNGLHPTVTNPIYETGEDVYEELPDQDSRTKLDALYPGTAPPPLPSARYDHLPAAGKVTGGKDDGGSAVNTPLTQTPKQGPKFMLLNIPPSASTGALSAHSADDCYTVMNPAGTMTVMSRSSHSGSYSLASGGSGIAAPGE